MGAWVGGWVGLKKFKNVLTLYRDDPYASRGLSTKMHRSYRCIAQKYVDEQRINHLVSFQVP